MTVKHIVGNILMAFIDHPLETFGNILLLGLVVYGPVFYQTQILAPSQWTVVGAINCGRWQACENYNATVLSVKDYEVTCSTWFLTGTCPREDLTVLVIIDPGQYMNGTLTGFRGDGLGGQVFTLNCHYYHITDHTRMMETFHFNNTSNAIHGTWSIEGPC